MTTPRNAFDPEDILAGILRWVRVESPTYDRAAVNRMMDVAAADMRDLGAAIERIPGIDGYGDCLRATVGGARDGPGVLVLGHLDTVHPVGTIDGRLPVRRDGDRVYGPGIFDMKGGMYLAVHALKETLRQRGKPTLPVTFLFIADEEVGSPTTRAMIEAEARRHRYVLVPEPSRGGTAVTGRHAFQRFWVTVHGRPAHAGATLRQGSSAISAMARLIQTIEAMSDFERGETYAVGVVQGGQWVNVVPIECRAQVLCVSPTEDSVERVHRNMLALAGESDGVRVAVEPGPVRPLFRAHDGTLALYDQARRLAADIGFDLRHGQFGGGSDGNFTGALGIATLDGLGVDGGGAHTHEEHLLVPSLAPHTRLLASLFETLGN
ncbi:M20/M25/M40 family metallo-hydrolase [Reyranella sp. CPCC 100927]|uniref:M20/M25/M40 family metallo-hydrolase n=1 Tax=Reyranella sp. CPCC 100927 TaxID=2599616 RepID=UPI0011B364C3|nr:M20/M25/M40 family metallo-hydrolase [Reyranella sp. CPCC 100927]TWS95804.1 M20/M25/M40 family metallo-hydrolase [Reyranella sp. CPCC 100927]